MWRSQFFSAALRILGSLGGSLRITKIVQHRSRIYRGTVFLESEKPIYTFRKLKPGAYILHALSSRMKEGDTVEILIEVLHDKEWTSFDHVRLEATVAPGAVWRTEPVYTTEGLRVSMKMTGGMSPVIVPFYVVHTDGFLVEPAVPMGV